MKVFVCIFTIIILTLNLFAQNAEKIKEARELVNQQENDKAKTILNELYDQNDEDPEVNYLLAVLSLRDINYDDAIDYLDVAIEADENNHLYYYMLGNAYGMKAQNSGALKAAFAAPKAKSNWEKTLEIKPDFLRAKQSLFQYYLNAPGIMGGDNDKAKEIADEILNIHPALGHAFQANYYLVAEENYDKVQQELKLSLIIDPEDSLYNTITRSNVGMLNRLGYQYLNNKDYDQSKKTFLQAIDLAPQAPNPYDSLGDYYNAVANYDSALVCYKKALEQNPKFFVSKMNVGRMLEKLNRKNEAIMVYKELVKENPDGQYGEQAEDRLDELE